MSRSRGGAAALRKGAAARGTAAARGGASTRLADAAPVFAALGDSRRLALVSRLCGSGPLSTARLSAGAGVTRQAITKHLEALAGAGLVRDTRRGRERVWELEPRRLERARRYLDQISDQWDAALGRLKAYVEAKP
jgi:DNA-binding transcriptional ArsR family regulator